MNLRVKSVTNDLNLYGYTGCFLSSGIRNDEVCLESYRRQHENGSSFQEKVENVFDNSF